MSLPAVSTYVASKARQIACREMASGEGDQVGRRGETVLGDPGDICSGVLEGTSRCFQLWIKDISSCVNVECVVAASDGRRHNDPRRSRKSSPSPRTVRSFLWGSRKESVAIGGSDFTKTAKPQIVPAGEGRTTALEVWPEKWGITVKQFARLLDECREDPDWSDEFTVADLVQKYVIPMTRGTGLSYAVLVNANSPKEVDVMISHAWAENALDFCRTLERSVQYEEPLFICALSLYQCEDNCGPTIAEQLGTYPQESPFHRVLQRIHDRGKEIEKSGGWWRNSVVLVRIPWILLVISVTCVFTPVVIKGCIPMHTTCAYGTCKPLFEFLPIYVWEWTFKPLEGHMYAFVCIGHIVGVVTILAFLVLQILLRTGHLFRGRMVAVPNHNCEMYTRLWCVFEMFVAQSLLVPVKLANTLASAGEVNSANAQCSKVEDAKKIDALAVLADRWLRRGDWVPPLQLTTQQRRDNPGAAAAYALKTFRDQPFVEACRCCGRWTASWCEGCYAVAVDSAGTMASHGRRATTPTRSASRRRRRRRRSRSSRQRTARGSRPASEPRQRDNRPPLPRHPPGPPPPPPTGHQLDPDVVELLATRPAGMAAFLEGLGVRTLTDIRFMWASGHELVSEFERIAGHLPADSAFAVSSLWTLALSRSSTSATAQVSRIVQERESTVLVKRPPDNEPGEPLKVVSYRRLVDTGGTPHTPTMATAAASCPHAKE
eukprot:s1719_g5.t1